MLSVRRSVLAILIVLSGLLWRGVPVVAGPSGPVSGVIRAPEGFVMPALGESAAAVGATAGGLRAVAIVGDVGTSTATYKQDMDGAVAALEAHGVTVTRFTYGDGTFTWADIVAAAQGASFVLYMGHGVYWGGSCANPSSVGGFYLGPGQFVTPNAVKTDMAGRLDHDAVIIFSHACYTAGSTSCDAAGAPGAAEAQRRVQLYAGAFTDLGFQAYFANNYFNSAAAIVNRLLDDPATRDNVGDVFRATYPNAPSNHRDLDYPTSGYDLWLNGADGNWDHAFVGQPSYVFGGGAVAQLGGLPTSVGFLHGQDDDVTTPAALTLHPANVSTVTPLTWSISKSGDWFSVLPLSGTTPDGFSVVPGVLSALPAGTYTGMITVSVTSPEETQATPQRIELILTVTAGPVHVVYLPVVARRP